MEGMAEEKQRKKKRERREMEEKAHSKTALKRILWACSLTPPPPARQTPARSVLKRPSAMINSQQEREREREVERARE